MRTRSRLSTTPYARNALAAARVSLFELAARVPVGWNLAAWGTTAAGPYLFEARHGSQAQIVSAQRVSDIPPALERLFVLVAEDSLEEQLAASLAERGIG